MFAVLLPNSDVTMVPLFQRYNRQTDRQTGYAYHNTPFRGTPNKQQHTEAYPGRGLDVVISPCCESCHLAIDINTHSGAKIENKRFSYINCRTCSGKHYCSCSGSLILKFSDLLYCVVTSRPQQPHMSTYQHKILYRVTRRQSPGWIEVIR